MMSYSVTIQLPPPDNYPMTFSLTQAIVNPISPTQLPPPEHLELSWTGIVWVDIAQGNYPGRVYQFVIVTKL
ncbi:hypothetical protein HOLleu_22874 [Holothuria leucospilota]|uniref:Uncharacterized protein n=1 Tax=Holothuria leucospilota TaxID=206669 RepID=A0A9Q1H2I3_HOLLE|nr:hypothetical protein HOLleu_22874 [Holothuria leucospilota]